MLVGVGAVLSEAQVDSTASEDAEFIVSSGFNQKVAPHCVDHGLPVCPGIATASKMLTVGIDMENASSYLSYKQIFAVRAVGRCCLRFWLRVVSTL